MKTNKKLFAVLLTLVMCIAFSTTAFAEESASPDISDPTAAIEKHTIEITVEPGEEITDDGVMPLIWDDPLLFVMNGGTADTPSFYVSERYFAYEVIVTGPYGETITSGKFALALMYNSSIKASMSGDPNGSSYKVDWITMEPGTYYPRAFNNSPAILKFQIIYYSWK